MNLAELAVKKKNVTLFAAIVVAFGGFLAYFELGKLEDPEFTIKTAIIITQYPGASPQQVEQEVTDVIETAVQKLDMLEHVRSISRTGLSIVYADVLESVRKEKIPQVWDNLRKKVSDAQKYLPPGTYESIVKDDFGDVYGVLLAVTGDGFSDAELKDYVKDLRRELLLVENVSKVEIWGMQQECVYVEISRARLSELGIAPKLILAALKQQNIVVDAGSVNSGRERLRFEPTGEFSTVKEIGDLVIRALPSDKLIYLKDIATIKRGYVEPPRQLMRFNGKPALGIAISTVSGGNVVEMGNAVKQRIRELMGEIPVGINIGVVSYQSDTVRESVKDFMANLVEAVVIVIVVLLISMGIRSGLLIGSGLLITILATFVVMKAVHIDLQRVSLGSLIIALGMLVDNAIVVTDGILVKLQRGIGRLDAIRETATETAWPLLGATIVAILAFLPIYISNDIAGEYCRSLFQVVGISLLMSWLVAMTATPLFCHMYLHIQKKKQGRDPYEGWFYQSYKRLLEKALHHRTKTLGIMICLLFLAILGFSFVDKAFFPMSRRPQILIDYWLPEGSRIESVLEDMKFIEEYLLKNPGIKSIASFIGSGPPRFYLPMEPEINYQSYGQIVVNARNRDDLDELVAYSQRYLSTNFPHAEPRVRKFPLGPPVKFQVEVRFVGPDPKLLHDLSEKAKAIMAKHPLAKDVRDNWRQSVKKIAIQYSQSRARRTAVSREDIGYTLKESFDGLPVGLYRERDELLPIIVRPPKEERKQIENLTILQVWGGGMTNVPLGQVISDITTEWEDPIIWRRDRQRCITAQCDNKRGNASVIRDSIQRQIEAIELPTGYELQWGGEFETSSKSEQHVYNGVPISLILMAFVIVTLFNGFRQPTIIALILPLSIIGITAGLLITRQSFGFLALLGALSLIGMLVKNAVVLIDRIDVDIQGGKDRYLAVVDSSVSRIRPVLMASVTTVFGMTPLLFDQFWRSMAVTIIFGLTFATLLTLIIVPALYSLFFWIKPTS